MVDFGKNHCPYCDQDEEIERLRDDLALKKEHLRQCCENIGKRKKQVEELENLNLNLASYIDSNHHITTEQIRAAWSWRGEFVARHCPSLFDDVMKELGIERREGFTHPSPKSQGIPSPVGAGALEEEDV